MQGSGFLKYSVCSGQYTRAHSLIRVGQVQHCVVLCGIIFLKETDMFKGKQADEIILQVCMPTTEYKDEEVAAVYERIEELLDKENKGKHYISIMGDWNAVVREDKEDMFVGHYGFGYQNDRGVKLVEFWKRRQMYVTVTWFIQNRRRRYTMTKPVRKVKKAGFRLIIQYKSKRHATLHSFIQRPFASNFHKANKQKHCRGMLCNKLNVERKCRPVTQIHAQERLHHSLVVHHWWRFASSHTA